MPQPICFSDGTYYACSLYPEIVSSLRDYPDICSVEKQRFQFKIVGVLCVEGRPLVVFPKNYKPIDPNTSYKVEAKYLIKSLLRYRKEAPLKEDEKVLLFGGERASGTRIASAMFLLEDYCQNGLLQRKSEISTTKQSGRVDWSATVAKQTPFFSNGLPIYATPVIRKHTLDNNSIVHIAHQYVLDDCFKEWGWLFDYDNKAPSDVQLPAPVSVIVDLLKKELQTTFLSREIQVITEVIHYLSETYGSESSEKLDIIATPYFSFVWEAICGFLFNNQYPRLKSLLPQPVWESEIVAGNIAQRPDIFYTNGSGLYILDAKYYNYTINIPGWHDVVKQLFYRHTMMSIKDTRDYNRMLPDTSDIYNAFIFPGNSDDFLYVGKFRVPRADDLGEVIAIAINQEKALSAYAKRETTGYASVVQQSIEIFFAEQD